ncbi:MAG: pilin [Bacillota bacterium]
MALPLRTSRIVGFVICLFLLTPFASHAAVGDTCDISHPCSTGLTCQLSSDNSGAKCVSAPAGTDSQNTAQNGASDQNTAQNGASDQNTGSNTDACGNEEGKLHNPLKFCSLPELMDGILQAVVELGAILLIFMLVWVGFLFVAAQGNPEKISAARSALIWVLIGGLILLGAEAISKVIEATVNSLTV